MALRIEDVSSLPGRKVMDQEGEAVGEIKDGTASATKASRCGWR